MNEPDYYKDSKEKIIARLRQLNTETANRLANEMEASQESTISGDMK
jgi:hypothetical protein